jgi:hypothetical protein
LKNKEADQIINKYDNFLYENSYGSSRPRERIINAEEALNGLKSILNLLNSHVEEGCDYCNTTHLQSMIGYQYMKYCPRCGKEIRR